MQVEDVAELVVRLPSDAQLYVDHVQCPLTSDTRTFSTPRLEPGRQYYYTLRAEVVRDGRPVLQDRRVQVTAGQRLEINFQELSPVAAARR